MTFAGDLRPLLRQVQRRAVRAEHQRRVAEPGHVSVHRTGRSGVRLRARHRPGELLTDRQRQLPHRQRLPRRRPRTRRSPRNSRCRLGRQFAQGLRPRDVHLAACLELHRGLHRRSDAPRARRRSSATASTSARSTTRVYRNSDDVERRYQAMQFIGRYDVNREPVSQRPLHGAAREQRQLRGRSGQPAGQSAPTSATGRRSSRRAASRTADSTTSSAARSVSGRSTTRASDAPARVDDRADLALQLGTDLFSCSPRAVPLSAIQLARNPGYARLPGGGTQTLYFGERGSENFEGYGLRRSRRHATRVPIWQTVRPWIKFELYNVFDNNKLISWDTTVTPDPTSPLDANGLPTGYIRPANFGTPRRQRRLPAAAPGHRRRTHVPDGDGTALLELPTTNSQRPTTPNYQLPIGSWLGVGILTLGVVGNWSLDVGN